MHLVKLQVHQCFSSNGASPAVPSASGALSRFPSFHESSEPVITIDVGVPADHAHGAYYNHILSLSLF